MKDKIIELRRRGFSVNEITKELNCTKSTVSYHINKIGLGGYRSKNKQKSNFIKDVPDDIIDKIKNYRLELKSYKEILRLVDISEDKLIKVCKIFGINTQTKLFKKKILNKDEILNYYLSVSSLRETAKFFKCSRELIRQYIPHDVIELNKRNKIKKTKSQGVIDWRKRKKIELIEYKGGCCVKCGYNKNAAVLQFHHINPDEKDFAVGGKSYSIERLKKEVDKCILICANCHIELHEELRNNKIGL